MGQLPKKRRFIVTAMVAGVTSLVAIGGGLALAAHRDVIVQVDGVSVPASGFLTDVSSALEEIGVELGEHDKVAPSLDSPVADGDTIVVRTAVAHTLSINGSPVTAWSTSDTLEGVISDANAQTGNVVMPANRSLPRAELPLVSTDRQVAVRTDGKEISVQAVATDSATDLLSKAKVTVSAIDRVAFALEGEKLILTVTRVSRGIDTHKESIAFTSEERQDETLDEGTTQVVQEGKDGSVVTATYRETIAGKTTVETVVSTTRTDATPRIVAVGTKKAQTHTPSEEHRSEQTSTATPQDPPQNPEANRSVSGDVWAGLAQCESGGNPAMNSGNGYYGMYQFSLPTWQSVGGSGLPSDASAEEQTMRAQILQSRYGWGQWPHCAASLGLY